MLLMPLTLYPTYLQSTGDTTHRRLLADTGSALPLWPSGPVWFLWLLVLWDVLAAGVYLLCAGTATLCCGFRLMRGSGPAIFLAGLLLASALAYVPLALLFGPSSWVQAGPFAFQLSRPLHYVLYFFAGAAIGACGIERGLFAPDGPLVRRWDAWLVAAVVLFFAWGGLTALAYPDPWADAGAAPLALRAVAELSFVLACFASCFFVFAAAVRFGRSFGGASAAARQPEGECVRHVPGALRVCRVAAIRAARAGLPALVKGAIVFAGTLALSWAATAALRRVPAVAHIIGADRRPAIRPASIRVLPAE